jgi:hypothetical protein
VRQALVSDETYPSRGAGATHRTTRSFCMGACAQLGAVHLDITASLSHSGGKYEAERVQGAVVATEECMDGDLTKASITPTDVRCRQPGCTCERSVPGTIVTDGFAVASEAGSSCPACQHTWSDHETLGCRKVPLRLASRSPESPLGAPPDAGGGGERLAISL